MDPLRISATGLNDAMIWMAATSHNIAAVNAERPTRVNSASSSADPDGQGVHTYVASRESVFGPDLVSEAVNLKFAQFAFAANAAAIKTTHSAENAIFDMFDSAEGNRDENV